MRGKGIWTWIREHKPQVLSVAVVATGLAARYVPGFPAEDVLRVIGAVLGVA